VSYINQDKFTFTSGLTLNGYTNLKDNDKAWGTVPMEFTSSLRWWAFQRFMFKADLYLFGGSKYIEKGNTFKTTDGGTDLSLGAEYRINKQFSIWLDANNIFNDKYERWHNYEVYGLNLTGGILIKF
jgi:outer membrane receptor protein involved in Fe transport